jgi:LysM repeat protein
MKNKYRLMCAIFLIVLLIFIICGYSHKYTTKAITRVEIYTVQPNDTLWKIAEGYTDGDPRELIYQIKQLNNIGSVIQPGQELKIPANQ